MHAIVDAQCLVWLLQSQEGYLLLKGDGSQAPTTQVHTFAKAWNLVGDGYESVTYGAVQYVPFLFRINISAGCI